MWILMEMQNFSDRLRGCLRRCDEMIWSGENNSEENKSGAKKSIDKKSTDMESTDKERLPLRRSAPSWPSRVETKSVVLTASKRCQAVAGRPRARTPLRLGSSAADLARGGGRSRSGGCGGPAPAASSRGCWSSGHLALNLNPAGPTRDATGPSPRANGLEGQRRSLGHRRSCWAFTGREAKCARSSESSLSLVNVSWTQRSS